jgi:quercetin dioxygenase-like cupin family protein
MPSNCCATIHPPVDLSKLAAEAGTGRLAWSHASQDLNVNLIVLQAGEKIVLHRNDEVDVLIVGVGGKGEITVDDDVYLIAPQTAILVPRGAERGIWACEAPFAYLTCHRERMLLRPKLSDEPDRGSSSER